MKYRQVVLGVCTALAGARFAAAQAPVAVDFCEAAATEEAKRAHNQEAFYVAEKGKEKKLQECAGDNCKVAVYFKHKELLQKERGGQLKKGENSLSKFPKCPTLFVAQYDKPPPPPGAAPGAAPGTPPGTPPAALRISSSLLNPAGRAAKDPEALACDVDTICPKRSDYSWLLKPTQGVVFEGARRDQEGAKNRAIVPQGVAPIVEEAVQILGQIVVDRASQQAYELLRNRLLVAFGCFKKEDGAAVLQGDWPQTCDALRALRLQELATAPQVLLRAVASDAFALLGTKNETRILLDLLAAQGGGGVRSTLQVEKTFDILLREARVLKTGLSPSGDLALLLATGAVLRCETLGESSDEKCPAAAIVETLAEQLDCTTSTRKDPFPCNEDARLLEVARELGRLLVRLHWSKTAKPQVQLQSAADASFLWLCTREDFAQGCPAVPPAKPVSKMSQVERLALLKVLVDATLEADTNALIVAATRVVEAELPEETSPKARRGLTLLAGLLQYARTFATNPATGDTQSKDASVAKHDQRTKILESLTAELTSRIGREGDDIVSLGGSLRGAAGVRWGHGQSTFWGPISLPLGFGFQHLARGSSVEFHAELSILDIGQYVTFDQKANVQKPDLGDSLSPSATVGLAWGKQVPMVVGASVGYAPEYSFDDGKRGGWYLGAVVGAYVPLFDLN